MENEIKCVCCGSVELSIGRISVENKAREYSEDYGYPLESVRLFNENDIEEDFQVKICANCGFVMLFSLDNAISRRMRVARKSNNQMDSFGGKSVHELSDETKEALDKMIIDLDKA